MTYSDKKLFTIKPSQLINFGYFLGFIIGTPLLVNIGPSIAWIPGTIYLVKFLEVYFWRYEFNEETIIERKGILNITRREIHYHRIKGISIEQPFIYLLFGLSKVHINSSDPFTYNFTFEGIHGGQDIRQYLRKMISKHRGRKGVKEFDMYSL
jgi:uncharacterized membrane protein YdbT with pleckstrin-like domain